MLKHFNYGRKSSEDEDRQMLSIERQLSELDGLAAEHGLQVVRTFTESKSAKESGREIFNDMLRRIEAGEANAILTWKLDRLARNFDDGGRIIGLLQRGVIQEIRTSDRVYLPTDNVLTIAVELGMANQYVRDLAANIRSGIREKLRRGIAPSKAPLGYFNEPRLRTIEAHPENFPKVKRLLECFATGRYSLTAFRRELAAAGLVGYRSQRPPVLSTIGKMLRNPFYYGVFQHKGELHQGAHVPMITKQTYDDIQRALVAVGRPRQSRRDKGFLFRHFATCGCCGFAVTAERHVKKSGLRFHYYHCTRKSKVQQCEERGFVREERMAEEIRRNVALVILPEIWKERFLARIETWESEATDTRQQKLARLKGEQDALKAKLDRLNNAFADGSLDLPEFREMKNPLVPRKVELEGQIAVLAKSRSQRLEPMRNWILEANQAERLVFEGDGLEMKSFLQKVGSNRLLRAQSLTVTFTKPWNSLAETNIAASCAASGSDQLSIWWSRGDSNP